MENKHNNIEETLGKIPEKEVDRKVLQECIINQDFYYNTGKIRLCELNEFDKVTLEKALVTLKTKGDKRNFGYDNFKQSYGQLSEAINSFVAYCDINAKGDDGNGKSYYKDKEGKRCIAKAFIRQNAWVINIIQYLLNLRNNDNEKDRYKNVSFGVKRALQYFEDPKTHLNILSEKHLKNIARYYLGNDDVGVEDFDKQIIEKFEDSLNECKIWVEENGDKISLTKPIDSESYKLYSFNKADGSCEINEENRTNIYTQIIYKDRPKWDTAIETQMLENNKNLILTGAPGTGKTYMARQIAAKMIGCNVEKLDIHEHFEFVQFHPSYDYTDFVEGLRPNYNATANSNLSFVLQYGTFKEFCRKATFNENAPHVFVIDEINRGEISKIFGELFFSIDPGYRGINGIVKTQYHNLQPQNINGAANPFYNGFYIPNNVYIIGTMNDIDRSVESMDFAFRRRFAFKEVKAMDTADVILSQLKEDEDKAYKKLVAINDKLTELGLSDSYHIGAAYFRKLDLYNGNCKWKSLWDYHLYGTLYEYFRGEPDVDKKMKQLSDAYNNAEENN